MDLVKLYFPFFSSLALLFFAFRSNFGNGEVLRVERFGFNIVITKTIAGRVAFLIASLSFFSYYLYMDFSHFFPSHFEIQVFYDKEGINKSLEIFNNTELEELGYKGENITIADEYYKTLDDRLRQILSYEGFFSINSGIVHSEGETSFKVQQTSGIHNYYVTESKGHLTHVLEVPGKPKISFLSFFDKMPSSKDYIRPSVSQIILSRELVISPRFKQIIAESNKSDGVVFDHELIGVTKINLFPYPSFSDTVYFYDAGNRGIVPIGYAIYK